jgi:predicted glutamine amidotransferase
MCGIFGIIKGDNGFFSDDASTLGSWQQYKMDTEEEILLKSLMYSSALRGTDATGFALVDTDNLMFHIKKLPVNAIDFSKLGDYVSVENYLQFTNIGILGHVRAGTTGGNSYRTAHPFVFGDIVGVHNGTLTGWQLLSQKAASDSEAFYTALSELSSSEYTGFLGKITGAYTFVWYNRATNKYYIARNDQRPLNVMQVDNANIVFASEYAAIEFAFLRATGSIEKRNEYWKKCRMINILPHTLYEIDPEEMSISETAYTIEEKKSLPAPVSTYTNTNTKSKYNYNKALELSPFSVDEMVEIIPTGFKEYEGRQGAVDTMGTIWGYINNGGKNYMFVSYAVKNVKKMMDDYISNFPNVIPRMYADIQQIYTSPDPQRLDDAKNMKDPLTGMKIHPEMDEHNYVLVHSIKAETITFDPIPDVVH